MKGVVTVPIVCPCTCIEMTWQELPESETVLIAEMHRWQPNPPGHWDPCSWSSTEMYYHPALVSVPDDIDEDYFSEVIHTMLYLGDVSENSGIVIPQEIEFEQDCFLTEHLDQDDYHEYEYREYCVVFSPDPARLAEVLIREIHRTQGETKKPQPIPTERPVLLPVNAARMAWALKRAAECGAMHPRKNRSPRIRPSLKWRLKRLARQECSEEAFREQVEAAIASNIARHGKYVIEPTKGTAAP